jgi:hypothetical protein
MIIKVAVKTPNGSILNKLRIDILDRKALANQS